jgi:hypothetical protein
MSKIKNCKSCGKEVAKSAKTCPNCGQKLKMGMMLKLLIGVGVLVVAGAIFGLSPEEEAAKLKDELAAIASAQPANIASSGQIAETFSLGSSSTDLQREDLEKQITGQIVQWNLPVYEVKRLDEKTSKYKIQTSSKGNSAVGAFVTIYARDDAEKQRIESLKTGDIVKIKGKITGTTMRNVNINPAVLVQ